MKIVGLDIGYESGLCVLDIQDTLIADVSICSITIPPERRTEFFVFNIAKKIEDKLAEIVPVLVCMEDYAYGGKGFFNVKQAEIQAQVKRFCVAEQIPLFSAHLQQMRKVMTGHGNIKKAGVRKFIKEYMDEAGFLDRYAGNKDYHVYDATLPALYGFAYVTNQLSEGDNKVVAESIIGTLSSAKV